MDKYKRLALVLSASAMFCSTYSWAAGNVTKPYNFSAGSSISSSQVNADFDALVTEMNARTSAVNRCDLSVQTNTKGTVLFSSNLSVDITDAKFTLSNSSTMSGAGIVIPGDGLPNQNAIQFYTTTTASVSAGAPYAAPSPKMVILPSGNVGIGSASPGAKLEVAGDIKQTACGTGKTLIYSNMCIDSTDRSATNMGNAQLLCIQAGGHVCREDELVATCTALGSLTTSPMWINDSSTGDDNFKITNTTNNCNNIDGGGVNRGNNYAYRCCYGVH